jgi:rubrerythrin
MPNLKGSQTEKNLMFAFSNEAQARNRYTYFSKNAIKEGFQQIGAIFLETAENELQHAKMFFRHLGQDTREFSIEGTYLIGLNDSTQKNLENAALGEHDESTIIYPKFAKVADNEGFKDIALLFNEVAKVEIHHEKRYRKLLENVKENDVFKKPKTVQWKCRKCGCVLKSEQAPPKCPCCFHPQAYFELLCDNF